MYGVYYSKMAYLSLKLNRHTLANDYYLRYKATRMSGTLMGALEINPYLLLIGRYEDVISNNKAFFLTTDNADTVSVVYRRSLLQDAISLKRLGKYEYAYRCLEKYNNIIESYRRNIDANRLFELYKAADYIRYEAGIEAARNELKSRQNLIVALFVLIGFLILFLIFILMERMMLRKKNRDISRLIVELNKSMESSVNELEKSDDVRSAEVVEPVRSKSPEEVFSKADLNKMSNEALFRRFDSIVMNERLYLDYNLQRDYYASVMGVDRNRDGGNLSTYLNNMRLNYSVTLFREHPEMSISEVGDASAIPNISTFYRLFKEKYGLSPKMFIEQLNSER